MKTNKILLGTLAGGVAFFFLGWVIYAMLLANFMATHYNNCMQRGEMDYVWWALCLSNLMWALTYAVIIDLSNMRNLIGGLKVGLLFGFLITLAFDLGVYSMSTMYSSLSTLCIDISIGTIYSAIGGGIIGWVIGMGKAEAA